MPEQDCIVIGGGHNGLTAAAYLARRGVRTTVLEARDIVGGFCTTEELVPEAPGFLFNPTSLDHVLLKVEPSIVSELQLYHYGLEYREIDPFYSYVRADGFSLCFWRDYRKTVAEIARFSKQDAKQYQLLTEQLMSVWKLAFPYLMGHPTRPSLKTMCSTLMNVLRYRKDLMAGSRIVLMSPLEAINTYFESDEMRTALAVFSASNMFPLEYPGTGIIFSIMALQHGWGVYRPLGGGGQLPRALRQYIEQRGGQVLTGKIVEEILLEGNKASGVRLQNGDTLKAKHVIAAVDPRSLCKKLLPAGSLPEQCLEEVRKLNAGSPNISTATLSIALSGLPDLPVDPQRADALFRSCILMADSLEGVRSWCHDSQAGIMGKQIPAWYIFPSYLDRSLVPSGSEGHTVYSYLPAVVKDWHDGSSWENNADALRLQVHEQLNKTLPGFQDRVIGDFLVSPDRLHEFSYNNPRHPFHVDMSLTRMGPWRPTPSLSGYKTPVKNLFHTGAGAHPMGTINGWSGRNVSKMLN